MWQRVRNLWKKRFWNSSSIVGFAEFLMGLGFWLTTGGLKPPDPIPITYWVGVVFIVIGIVTFVYGVFKGKERDRYIRRRIIRFKSSKLLKIPDILWQMSRIEAVWADEILKGEQIPLGRIKNILEEVQYKLKITPYPIMDKDKMIRKNGHTDYSYRIGETTIQKC